MSNAAATIRASAADLARRLDLCLAEAGASEASRGACVAALLHASRLGVDSHGARLVVHYAEVLREGRVNGDPQLRVTRTGAATAVVDGDDGLGHFAAYRAAREAVDLAKEAGVGAVGVVRSSHFGAAGAYAKAVADAGMVGFATTNSDSAVALFGGAAPFHGTNPLAFAAPSGGERPWLLDMATSSIPFNRVFLYRTLGLELPEGVAADGDGAPTRDARATEMLLPAGGPEFGFKGAGLAGVATVLSAVLQGMAIDPAMLPMAGEAVDKRTPRGMGHFVLAIDPACFGGAAVFEAGMRSYLAALRGAPARPGESVMAPGDREWRTERERERDGIPVDPETARFLGLDR
ncbi:Ldh family oxidoreductase [Aureimonas leprariae]|uniref:Ldh family oxidoreductase n=1 Tax=Plantimonas leprariae TaxID=2615207 RepID=A0A7V7PK93_9HYPH|nr:Ldh family oxidoreductase [Aureimonas leprariae]KAB0675995.1 Ldh family oxidoreductase [Aureimonas leprariae]